MEKRIEYIDLAKGICISLVVLLHVFGQLSGDVIKMMNLFRMPLYFVLSGMFFKSYDGMFPFIKKKTNRLLVPFMFIFLFVIIPTTVLLNIKSGIGNSFTNVLMGVHGQPKLGIVGASWFLVCLFAVNFYFYIICLFSRNSIKAALILSLVCGYVGYEISQSVVYLPLWLDSALTAVPFFFSGYYMRLHSNILYGKKSYKDFLHVIMALAVLVATYLYNQSRHSGIISYGDNCFDVGIIALYLGGVTGTYTVLSLSKILNKVPGVSYIGRYSIVVLLTHQLYLFAFRNILFQLGVQQDSILLNSAIYLLLMLLEIPTIWFCIRYLPYCFAQKDLW